MIVHHFFCFSMWLITTQALTKTLIMPTTLIIYSWRSLPIIDNTHAQVAIFCFTQICDSQWHLPSNFSTTSTTSTFFWMLTLVIWKKSVGLIYTYYEKMGWFVIGLVIEFLSCNDHLQLITTQCISTSVSVIKQVAWVVTDATHHMWNYTHIQFVQLNYNYVGSIIV